MEIRKRKLIVGIVVLGFVFGFAWFLKSIQYQDRLPKLEQLQDGNTVSLDRFGPPWHEYFSSDPQIVKGMKELLTRGIYTGSKPRSPGENDASITIYSYTLDHKKVIWKILFDPKTMGTGTYKPAFEALVRRIFQIRDTSLSIDMRLLGESEKDIEEEKRRTEIRDRQNGRY